MKSKIVIGLLVLVNIFTILLLVNNQKELKEERQEKEYYKLFKTEIVDTLDNELYIVDGDTLQQGQFYNIHFKYNIDTKNKNNNWYELYIDDDFSY